jgi:hypothetical protein
MGGGGGDPASGSGSRHGAQAGHRQWRRWPGPARTQRPVGGARCTSAACRTGSPRRGCARSATGDRPGWGWHPTGGDLTNHPALGQDLPAGLPAVAGVQVHGERSRQRTNCRGGDARRGVKVAASSPSSRRWAGAGRLARGMPPAWTATERFSPCLRRSTGLGPATRPPQGALVMQPSTARSSSSKPNSWSAATRTARRSWSATPAVIHSSRRRRRVVAEQPWSAMRAVAAAEHQHLDELVEADAVGNAGAVAAQRMGVLAGGPQGRDLDPQGFQDRRWPGRHETS